MLYKLCEIDCKKTITGHINFCENSGKIILDMFLDSGKLMDCDFEEKR